MNFNQIAAYSINEKVMQITINLKNKQTLNSAYSIHKRTNK